MELPRLLEKANIAAHTFWHCNEYDLMFAEGNKQEASYIVYGDLLALITPAILANAATVDNEQVELPNDLETMLHEFVISQYNEVSTNERGISGNA